LLSGAGVTALVFLFLAVLVASWTATWGVLVVLRRRAVLDRPNARSSHSIPTPRGGGLAVIGVVLPAWAALIALGAAPASAWIPLVAAGGLAALSFLDDLRPLPPLWRLVAQGAAVAVGIAALPAPILHGLAPDWADALIAGFVWLWFVNLYNFMDGIDGIAGVETACLGFGIAAAYPSFGLTLAAAALGFLAWNWQPAKLFLGDVGSVPLGYLAGWLLLVLAGTAWWQAALILPLYYLADATWTLLRRLACGERVWVAHREHFYQRAVQAGLSHAAVAGRILAADLILVGLAFWSREAGGVAPLALAVVVVALLLVELARRPTRPGNMLTASRQEPAP
jgi:UDP-N-acetylmuramyl pentapeptide phosphotransferase/UDP-N-acetylglucosamine-1-phosphate transferase